MRLDYRADSKRGSFATQHCALPREVAASSENDARGFPPVGVAPALDLRLRYAIWHSDECDLHRTWCGERWVAWHERGRAPEVRSAYLRLPTGAGART